MRWFLYLTAAVLGLALDLLTKDLAFARLPAPGQREALMSWLSLAHAENHGAAFGLFAGQTDWFMVVTVTALVGLTYGVHSAPRRARALPLVLGLLLAGVLGNFRDRVVLGFVRDFIHVHAPAGPIEAFFRATIGRADWFVFNVADAYIDIGAVWLLVLLGRKAAPTRAPGAPPGSHPLPDPEGSRLMMPMRWILFLVALVLGTALDLGSKHLAFDELPDYGQTHPIWSWFSSRVGSANNGLIKRRYPG